VSDERPATPTRAEYVVWRTLSTRWADDDVYGHMNNARYFELIDTAVNAYLVEATGRDIRALPAIGVVAEVSCRYFRGMGFPAPVDVGLRAEHVGRSSVVYRIGLFQGPGEEASAEGRFVHVYVDNTAERTAAGSGTGSGHEQRAVVPVPEEIRTVVSALLPST
jgi:acyl-CoA thioester hydrolase